MNFSHGFFSALAEAGIIPSKLSPNYRYDGLGDRGKTYFYPERYDVCIKFCIGLNSIDDGIYNAAGLYLARL